VAARSRVPVLCYHQIRPVRPGDAPSARPYIVDPGTFARQIRALDRAGYEPVGAQALVDHLARGAPLPPRPVVLTFDDGSAGQYRAALPVLRRHGFTATFFVMTVALDKPGWLTRRQVRALDRAGMTIGAHTWDHQPVPDYAQDDWRTQVDAPTRELSRLVGHPVRLFAYPFGRWRPEAIPHLWHAGLRAGFQLAGEVAPAHPLWSIRRIIVPGWSPSRLLREIRADF
jgi:peptidoglycan/xylan/chitin deacetylase (PgdA/CDA1 family)